MSLLIKGMEMPKKCTECLMREPLSDYCELLLRYLDREELNGRDADCLLAELPEKHGRLIDADTLIAEWKDVLSTDGISPMFAMVLESAIRDVERAKVLVEAEGKDT